MLFLLVSTLFGTLRFLEIEHLKQTERAAQGIEVEDATWGKLVELAIRDVVHGLPVKNTDALANPEALEQFRDRKELRDQA